MNEKAIDEMTDLELRQDLVDLCKEINVEMIEKKNDAIEFRKNGESVEYFGFESAKDLYITAMYNLSQCTEAGLREIHDGDTVWPNGTFSNWMYDRDQCGRV